MASTRLVQPGKIYRPEAGIVTLTVGDSNGRPIKRVRAHNQVAPWVTAVALVNYQKDWYVPSALSSPFQTFQSHPVYLWLLTDTRPEGPGDGIAIGTVLGYGNGSSGSSGTMQGAFNSTASYVNTTQAHLVYDFATNQANGTIGSVGLLAPPLYITAGGSFAKITTKDISSLVSSPYGVAYDGTNLWVLGTTSGLIAKINPSTWTVAATFAAPSSTSHGLAWNGSGLMVAEYGSNGRVYTVDPTNGSVVSSFVAPGGAGFYSITWGGGYLWGAQGGTTTVYKMSQDGSVVAQYTVDVGGGYPITLLSYIPSVNAIRVRNQSNNYGWLNLDGTMASSSGAVYSYAEGLYAEVNATTWVEAGGPAGNYLRVEMPYQLVTRAVLPQPLVKTSANTLEVAYDLYF